MAGTEGLHGGSHDLLKQATQAMMSRYAVRYGYTFGGLSHFHPSHYHTLHFRTLGT
jgi:hypothetical protein